MFHMLQGQMIIFDLLQEDLNYMIQYFKVNRRERST